MFLPTTAVWDQFGMQFGDVCRDSSQIVRPWQFPRGSSDLRSIGFLKGKVATGSFRGWGSFDSPAPTSLQASNASSMPSSPTSSHFLQQAKTRSIDLYRGSGPGHRAHASGKLAIQPCCTLMTPTRPHVKCAFSILSMTIRWVGLGE